MKSNIQVFVFCAVSLFNSETSGEWAGLAHSKIFYGETFTTIAGVSFQACMDECSSRAVCMSLNYNRKLLRCQLNSRAANDVTDLVQARGYLYVGNKQKENHNCSCALNKKYCEDKPGKVRCSVKECKRLFPRRAMFFKGNMNSVGSKVLVNCRPILRVIKEYDFPSFVTKCEPSGEWSELDERKCGKEVFRGKQNVKGAFLAWKQDSKDTYNYSSCPQDGTNQMSCDLVHYRNNDIDQWESLNITHVLFSVFNQYDIEVKYVLFNGTGSTKLNWFSQENILASNWIDISNITANEFSLRGQNIERASCMIRRRFLMGVMSDDCAEDRGWFLVTYPKDVDGCCVWDNPVTAADIIYSRGTTVAHFSDSYQISRANYFKVMIFSV